MDNSTSVREAAVELLGRFVLSRPQLIEQYYDMLIERILVISHASLFIFFTSLCEVKGIIHEQLFSTVVGLFKLMWPLCVSS